MGEIRLRILTFNTHLMADSNLVVGAWVKNKKPVVFQDDDRYAYIVAQIKRSGADIVALQEVWAKKRMKQILDDLREYHGAEGAHGDYMFKYLAEFIISGIPKHAAGSGLILLSKHPFVEPPQFELFHHAHDDEERAASKGTLTATIHIGGRLLRLGMTHAWTDAGHDCSNINDLVNRTTKYRQPASAVMMGDFNIHRRGNPTKFQKLTDIMINASAKDSWTLAHGSDLDGSETDDQAHNNLSQFFSPMRNTEPADCIDYLYVKSTEHLQMKVAEAKVLRDWKYPTDGKTPKWYWVHDGTVAGTPSATPFGPNGDKLCVVTRETDGHLRAAVFDRKTDKWKSDLIKDKGKNVTAHGAPGLAWWNNTLHLFFRGKDFEVMKVESQDGETWSSPNAQGFGTSGGCCAIVFLDKLHVFVRHPDKRGNQIRYHVWTNKWSDPRWIGLETDHNISAAVIGDQMCVVARDPGKPPRGIMHVRIDRNGNPSPRQQIAPHASTSGSPGVTATRGNFVVFFREPKGGGIFTRNSGTQWTKEEFTSHATNDEVCPVTWGDKTLLFFSRPVWNTRKVLPGKLSYPDDAVLYPERAFTHGYWPSDVNLDASDHYPYQVDLVLTV